MSSVSQLGILAARQWIKTAAGKPRPSAWNGATNQPPPPPPSKGRPSAWNGATNQPPPPPPPPVVPAPSFASPAPSAAPPTPAERGVQAGPPQIAPQERAEAEARYNTNYPAVPPAPPPTQSMPATPSAVEQLGVQAAQAGPGVSQPPAAIKEPELHPPPTAANVAKNVLSTPYRIALNGAITLRDIYRNGWRATADATQNNIMSAARGEQGVTGAVSTVSDQIRNPVGNIQYGIDRLMQLPGEMADAGVAVENWWSGPGGSGGSGGSRPR
jgi:hypothetical protein